VSKNPLSGKTIIVTRARHQASRLSRELETLGAHVIEIPAIEIVSPESYAPLDTALRNLQQYQWLIVTSANTVRVLGERIASFGLNAEAFASINCVAIGSATADALRNLGLPVALVPSQYVAESLVDALRDRVAGSRVLLARAAIARDIIPDELRKAGAMVDVVEAYQTVIPESSIELVRGIFHSTPSLNSARNKKASQVLDPRLPDAVTFTSSSTVTNFFQLLKNAGIASLPTEVKAISIGPVTSATLRESGWEPAAEANPHNVSGLVQAAMHALQMRKLNG
jgi:uroporphyrinogen-III synthase